MYNLILEHSSDALPTSNHALTIVGNLLDVGAKTQLSSAAVHAAFEDALTAPLRGSVEGLAQAICSARSILYLADNAGEIAFDRDLLAQLPRGHLPVVVCGRPVLNDAILTDAEQAGLTEFCEVIANGSDAPGTLLTDCSLAFRERFAAAPRTASNVIGLLESVRWLLLGNQRALCHSRCHEHVD